ncbi:MAG: nitric oxide reductase activation protein NorD, partial [Desulfatirhabdiaceae bacterium]
AYLQMCGSVSHLRPQKAIAFYSDTLSCIRSLDQHPCGEALLADIVSLAELNWALLKPCVSTFGILPADVMFLKNWIDLASRLATRDIDVGINFLNQTPTAREKLGLDAILTWGEQALVALSRTPVMWQAVSAYLQQSAALQCGFTLSRWNFFLEQAGRIASKSSAAAEGFINLGNQACLLLTDEETVQWVNAGLATASTEPELVKFFTAGSLRALETRDGLASGVTLKDRRQTLTLICEALLGRAVKIRANTVLYGHPGFTGGAATDGHSIFLPEVVPSFGLMKLMVLHQAMLIDRSRFLEESGRIFFDAIHIHQYADKRLIQRLPSIVTEMNRLVEGGLPQGYPHKSARYPNISMPWWGNILPDLIRQANTTIDGIRAKVASQYEDLPPELVDMLIAQLMSQGEQEPDALAQMLASFMDNLEFMSPDAEDLPDVIRTFLYREWDMNLSDYKLDWCLVRHRLGREDSNPFVENLRTKRHGLINLIRRQFTRLKPEQFRRYRAQPAGDELDIDALVETWVDMCSGSHLSENVYIRRDKRIRDVAVLFLVDLSGSTEEKVDDRRIVDIQKEAMVLMAEALNALGDPYAILGFTSDGRFRVDMIHVKDFSEPYDDRVCNRLGNLEPAGLTRMGAVVRHAIYKLESQPAAIKILVILTDGRPYDLEYGNLDYAISDTHKAIQEARRKRIHPFIITSDVKSTDYLRRIAPQTQSIIVPRVELLPGMLPAIYKRLTV